MRFERRVSSNTSGWLAYVLPLVVATGCSLTLAAPIARSPAATSRYVQQQQHQQPQQQQAGAPIHPDAMALAREFLDSGRLGQAPAANGLSFNNHVSNINIGNNKHTNYANTGHVITPKKGSSLFSSTNGRSAFSGSLLASSNVQPASVQVTPVQQRSMKKQRKSATPEQKEMKLDPNVELYKRKLQNALKALSAKKLPANKLREALEGIDAEQSVQVEPHPDQVHEELYDSSEMYQGHDDDGHAQNLYDGIFDGQPLPQDDEGLLDDEHAEQAENEQHMDLEDEMNSIQVDPSQGDDSDILDEQSHDFYNDQYQPLEQQFYGDESERDYDGHSDAGDFDHLEHISNDGSEPEGSSSHDESEFHDGTNELPDDLSLINQVREALDDRLNRISDLLYFRPEFMNQLLQIQDAHLTPIEREFKRMVLCNSDEQFCDVSPSLDGPTEAQNDDSEQHDHAANFDHQMQDENEWQPEPSSEHEEFDPEFYHEEHQEENMPAPPGPQDFEEDHFEHEEEEHMMPPAPHQQAPMFAPGQHQMPRHYSRSSSSVYFAQNQHEQMSHMSPNGQMVSVATSAGPTGSGMSHAMSAVSDGRGDTIVKQSLNGAPAQILRQVSAAPMYPKAAPLSAPSQQSQPMPPMVVASPARAAQPAVTSAPAPQQMRRRQPQPQQSQPQQPQSQPKQVQQQPQPQPQQQRAQLTRPHQVQQLQQQQPRQRQVPVQQQQQQQQQQRYPQQMRY